MVVQTVSDHPPKDKFLYLVFAGALPFVICAGLLYFGHSTLPIFGSLQNVLSAYALVIASFLAGINWGQFLHLKTKEVLALPKLSNVMAISVWVGFLILPFQAQMIFFSATFATQLWIDWRLFRTNVLEKHYFSTRLVVSGTVITSLIVAALSA